MDTTLAASGSDFGSLSTYHYAYAQQAPRQSPDNLLTPAAQTSIAVSYTKALSTGGPVRSGYLQIEGYGSGAGFNDGGASMTSGILLGSGSAYQTEVTCYSYSSHCTSGTGYYTYNSLIPVTLGTAFTIEANGGTTNWASAFDGSSGGSLSTVYNFRFLEADGVTSAAVSQAPEPATLGMIGLAFSSLVILRKAQGRRYR
ncbi:MAG: PEP-CTERM sorting domain-containing protein [Bryobacteraceae bacterium]